MTRNTRDDYKPRFFPFSAGIPWKIERGKFIIPEIDSETWHKVLDGKDIIITAFGGLFESFFSLSVAEALVAFDPGHTLYWLGNTEFSIFAKSQNLCKISMINMDHDTIANYPTPIFFDQSDRAYFNVLNNYLVRTSYWGKYPELVKAPAVHQIFRNSMAPWHGYVPKLRQLGSEFYEELCGTSRIRSSSRIVLIVLDSVEKDVLGWNIHNIREFSQLASTKGLKVIVMCRNSSVFYGTKVLAFEYDLRKILQIMVKSWMILSSNIHWLLIGMMISNAKIVGQNLPGPFDLFENAEALELQNDIFTDAKCFSPMDVFTITQGLL